MDIETAKLNVPKKEETDSMSKEAIETIKTGKEMTAKDIETKEVPVLENVNEMSKEIKNVPEISIGELLENV